MANPKKKLEKNDLIKASAAIQIEGKITLLQRRAWNVLLAHAYDELPHKDKHSIPVQHLMDALDYNSTNQEYLKECLRMLTTCSVEWNLLDKDGYAEWGAAALLAGVKISRGTCSYQYGSFLREKLYSPYMYARLSLLIQNQFASKHGLTLWELCVDYLGAKRDAGETPWIGIEDFRKLMGIEESAYYAAFFKKLKQQVITPALAEINRVSDCNVTVEYQLQARKVTALKFIMQRVVKLPVPQLPRSMPSLPHLDDMPPVITELTDVGFSLADATAIWRKKFGFVEAAVRPAATDADTEAAFLDYVRDKLHLLARQQAAGSVTNGPGFVRQALRHNYAPPALAADAPARAAAHQAAPTRAAQQAHLKHQIEEVQRAWDTALGATLSTLADTQPHVVEAAVRATLAATPFLRYVCSGEGPPLGLYRTSLALRSVVNTTLVPHLPAQVAALTAQYAPQLAALQAQRAALEADAPTSA